MKFLTIILTFIQINMSNSQNTTKFSTHFETSMGKQTATYHQVIDYYQKLANEYPQLSIQDFGTTDSGYPLHLVILNPDIDLPLDESRKSKSLLLINNGIHPGESDGIDASMMLFRDIVQGKLPMPRRVIVATIPVYNIGGSLNRNSHTRANQNGPEAYGFRGNARNYDLNRDFIKSDSKNAKAFASLFHQIQPDVFIDNHVSNGADYQYTLTHLFTQHNKLGGRLGEYLHTSLMPALENKLKKSNWDITPYVNVFNRVPETGFSQFMDSPRYSTGYTSLFNVFGMMVETHMLKPYKQRVEGTYQLMLSMIEIMETETDKIKQLRHDYSKSLYEQTTYPLDWELDEGKSSTINFKGYQAQTIDSKVTSGQRLKYDRSKPFTKPVKYQNYFKPRVTVTIPKAYIIPKQWHEIIALLKLNRVEVAELKEDQSFLVESYRIKDYETMKSPYEGHYAHFNTQIVPSSQQKLFSKGDYIIHLNQDSIRYLIETLEPQAPDSFFNWNKFDTILQQKEHFSPYVFEEIAEEILNNDPQLMKQFKHKQKTEKEFNENWYAQLDWVHKHSKYYENAHMQYPVYRVLK